MSVLPCLPELLEKLQRRLRSWQRPTQRVTRRPQVQVQGIICNLHLKGQQTVSSRHLRTSAPMPCSLWICSTTTASKGLLQKLCIWPTSQGVYHQPREIQTATLFLLPRAFTKPSVSEGTKAMSIMNSTSLRKLRPKLHVWDTTTRGWPSPKGRS